MTLIALANALHDGAMRVRFHAEPIVQATELLLQERTPRDAIRLREEEVKAAAMFANSFRLHHAVSSRRIWPMSRAFYGGFKPPRKNSRSASRRARSSALSPS
jgi:hypothetical protein